MATPITTIPFRPSFGGSFEELYNPPEIAGRMMEDLPGFYGSAGFDLGTASASDLSQTTAAPADGPSTPLGADAERPANPYGLDPSKLSDANKLNYMMFNELLNQRSTAEDDERRFKMIQTLQREDAERANEMGRRNYDKALIGSMLQRIPEFMAAPARAAATYDNLNAQGPYFGAQNSKRYFS